MCSEIDIKFVMDALREMFDGDDTAVVRWLYKLTIFLDGKTPISTTRMAISHDAKHEPPRKLLGQCSNGKVVPKSENGMDLSDRLSIFSGSNSRY